MPDHQKLLNNSDRMDTVGRSLGRRICVGAAITVLVLYSLFCAASAYASINLSQGQVVSGNGGHDDKLSKEQARPASREQYEPQARRDPRRWGQAARESTCKASGQ
jgi:hypothetical protein